MTQTSTPSGLVVRSVENRDYPAVAAIATASDPRSAVDAETLRFDDAHHDPRGHLSRVVAERDGRAVAYAVLAHAPDAFHPQKMHANVVVHPDARERGVGSHLHDAVLRRAATLGATEVRARAREDDVGARFLERRGWREEYRTWRSFLDLARFDDGADALEATLEARGVRLCSYAELAADPARDEKLWRLEMALTADMPSTVPFSEFDFAFFRENFLENPSFLPDAHLIAVTADGAYVGLNALWATPDPALVHNGTTGVRREYRRRGIALALKTRNLRWARARGFERVDTWNDRTNQGMLAINERLGFVKEPATIGFVKAVGGAS